MAARGICAASLPHVSRRPRQGGGAGPRRAAGATRLSRPHALPHRRPPARASGRARSAQARRPASFRPAAVSRAGAPAPVRRSRRVGRPPPAGRHARHRGRRAAAPDGRFPQSLSRPDRPGEPARPEAVEPGPGSGGAMAHLARSSRDLARRRSLRRERRRDGANVGLRHPDRLCRGAVRPAAGEPRRRGLPVVGQAGAAARGRIGRRQIQPAGAPFPRPVAGRRAGRFPVRPPLRLVVLLRGAPVQGRRPHLRRLDVARESGRLPRGERRDPDRLRRCAQRVQRPQRPPRVARKPGHRDRFGRPAPLQDRRQHQERDLDPVLRLSRPGRAARSGPVRGARRTAAAARPLRRARGALRGLPALLPASAGKPCRPVAPPAGAARPPLHDGDDRRNLRQSGNSARRDRRG